MKLAVTLCALLSVAAAIHVTPEAYRFLDASASEATDKCGAHSLCTMCLLDSDCIWCADGKGSCISGSPKGPKVPGSCKAYESEYCTGEPCSTYSNCHTCGADPFCGWCSTHNVCVEGDKAGPLTGSCPAWEYNKCSKEALAPGATGGATGGVEGTPEGQAAQAIADTETVAKGIEAANNQTKGAANAMAHGGNSAVNVIRMLKNLIKEWKAKKEETAKKSADDRGFFAKRFDELDTKRKGTLEALRKVVDEQYKEELAEEALLKKKAAQDAAFDSAGEGADKKLEDQDAAAGEASAEMPSTFEKLDKWMKTLSAKDRMLLKGLKRASQNRVERELHRAATRKMQREEVGWYACAYLLQDSKNNCDGFHALYNGQLKDREISDDEHTRVCTVVDGLVKKSPHRPNYNTDGSVRKDLYLAWCVNNVKLPTV